MARHPDPDNPQPYQRRIGERHPIRVEITWGPLTQSRWSRKKPWKAWSDNLSLSGVGFDSETRPGVVRGQFVRLTLDDVTAVALVKVARPDDSGSRTHYGLEFHEGTLQDAAARLVAAFEESAARG